MSIIAAIPAEQIGIGTKFIPVGKRKDVYTVIDIIDHVSRKNGKTFYTEYLTEHEFMGQIVRSRVNIVTIQRGLMQNGVIS